MNRTSKIAVILIVFSFMLFPYGLESEAARAQQGTDWAGYDHIPFFDDNTEPPFLVADQNHTVHAFTSQWVGEGRPQFAVIYNKWTLAGGWTPPVDIVLAPIEQARVMGVYLDPDGIIHLIFWGGNDMAADLFYTSAPASSAGNARAWAEPELIGKEAIAPSSATLVGDGDGTLLVVYSGSEAGNGYYAVHSTNGGQNWSDPEPFYLTNNNGVVPFGIQMDMDETGHVHAVWYTVDQLGHNQKAYYARLDLDQWKWNQPIEFDQGVGIDAGMGISYATIIEHNGELFIVYNNGIPPTGVPPSQYYIRSQDGGQTWTKPLRVSNRHEGRSGTIALLVDSEDKLHFIFPDRIPILVNGVYDAIGGVWHSVWQGNRWSEPEPVAARSGSESSAIMAKNPDAPFFGPSNAMAAISQGNYLLVTWRSDPGYADNGVWFSYKMLDTPELPAEPLPSYQNGVEGTPAAEQPVLSAEPTAQTTPVLVGPGENQSSPPNSPAKSLLVGMVPVILFISLVIGWKFLHRVR